VVDRISVLCILVDSKSRSFGLRGKTQKTLPPVAVNGLKYLFLHGFRAALCKTETNNLIDCYRDLGIHLWPI